MHGIAPLLAAIWEGHTATVKLLLAKVGVGWLSGYDGCDAIDGLWYGGNRVVYTKLYFCSVFSTIRVFLAGYTTCCAIDVQML